MVNNSLLSINKAVTSAKAQVQIEMWKKKKCTTSRLPSLHVDDFTAIVSQGIVNQNLYNTSQNNWNVTVIFVKFDLILLLLA